jgi:hypothetical protein
MRKAGAFVTPGAHVIAIDMATSEAVQPSGPAGVIVTDREVLLLTAGPDASIVEKVPSDEIVSAESPEAGRIAIPIADPKAGVTRVVSLDFRYFGERDDTIAKLLSEFG